MILFIMSIPLLAYLLLILSIAVVVSVGIDIREVNTIATWAVWMQVLLFGYLIRKVRLWFTY